MGGARVASYGVRSYGVRVKCQSRLTRSVLKNLPFTLALDSDPITSETDSVETTKDSESSIHLCNHPSGYSLIEPDFRCIADVLSHAI